VALNLGPGEEVVFEGHPCWRAILDFYVKGILIVAVIAVIAALVGASTALVTLIVVAGAAIVVLAGLIRRIATRYTITTRRLNIKHGIISRDVQETKIERVQDVNYRQTALQRILQIGDVDFDTAAENSASDFIFAGVANPEQVVERVHRATEPAGPPPRTRAEADRRYDPGL